MDFLQRSTDSIKDFALFCSDIFVYYLCLYLCCRLDGWLVGGLVFSRDDV